jgi:hypothetical protein
VNVAPREILDTVERVLYRRGLPPGAARPAARLVLAAVGDGVDALHLLWEELDGLEQGGPSAVSLREDGAAEVDGGGANALVVGPGVLDLLESGIPSVSVRGAGAAPLFAVLPGAARERGLVVEVTRVEGRTHVTARGTCEPADSRLRVSLAVDEALWSDLNRYASDVLAPASERSRADAGY